MQNPAQKVAIITGAGIGIGYEITLQLTRERIAVVLNDIDKKVVESDHRRYSQHRFIFTLR